MPSKSKPKSKSKSKFDFGPPSENLKKALAILKPGIATLLGHKSQELEWIETQILIEEIRRVRIIANYYGLPYFRETGLSMTAPVPSLGVSELLFIRKLASDFIVGFNVLSPKRGNPRSALSSENLNLIKFIDDIIQNEKLPKSRAFTRASHKGNPGYPQNKAEIENSYYRGKRLLAKLEGDVAQAIKAMEKERNEQLEKNLDALGKPYGLLGPSPTPPKPR